MFDFIIPLSVPNGIGVILNFIIIIIIIIIIIPWEFFTSALADSLSLEFKWQRVSSCLQDSSKYSGRSQLCSSLHGLHSSSYFQVLHSLY